MAQDPDPPSVGMVDWPLVLEQECLKVKSEVDGLTTKLSITSATLMAIISVGLSIASSQELSFEDLVHIAPTWVGVQTISMGVILLYASYDTSVAHALRKAASSNENLPLTAVRLLDVEIYLTMSLGCASVVLGDRSRIAALFFIVVALVLLASALAVLRGWFTKGAVEVVIGRPSRSKDPLKRIQMDIQRGVRWLLTASTAYLALGGLIIWLVWDSSNWPTVISVSVLVTATIRFLEKSFHQYEARVQMRQKLNALAQLRIESLTNADYTDDLVRMKLRQIEGLADGVQS